MNWRRRAMDRRPAKASRHGCDGCFALHPKREGLEGWPPSVHPVAVLTMYTRAASEKGRGATLGDQFPKDLWPPETPREGVNCKE